MRFAHFALLILGAAAVRLEQKAPVSVATMPPMTQTLTLQIANAVGGDPTDAQIDELVGELKAAAPFTLDTFLKIMMTWGKKYDITPPNAEAEKMGPKAFLTKVFHEVDANGDGKIDTAELMKALADSTG